MPTINQLGRNPRKAKRKKKESPALRKSRKTRCLFTGED
jgi:ribosomal protein S12